MEEKTKNSLDHINAVMDDPSHPDWGSVFGQIGLQVASQLASLGVGWLFSKLMKQMIPAPVPSALIAERMVSERLVPREPVVVTELPVAPVPNTRPYGPDPITVGAAGVTIAPEVPVFHRPLP